MNVVHRLMEKVRTGEQLAAPVAAVLTAATCVPRAGMWLRRRRPRVRVDARVISVGNLTAGGTGKTPAVIERAKRESADGRIVGILTRGYGHTRQLAPIVIAQGHEAARMGDVVGDEPALIASKAPEAFIARAADRVKAARILIETHGCDVLILDDGFQYVHLERDEDIVLIDASNPFGNERLIPRGILREPIGALARATHLILTRCDQAPGLEGLLRRVRALCPDTPIRQTMHAPVRLRRICDGETASVEVLRGRKVSVACAIGSPESFTRTLTDLGATVTESIIDRDHGPLVLPSNFSTGMAIVTEKDAARMRHAPENIWALEIELRDV